MCVTNFLEGKQTKQKHARKYIGRAIVIFRVSSWLTGRHLLLGGNNLSGLLNGVVLLLLLLLAGNEGGGRKGENSDGLHNDLY